MSVLKRSVPLGFFLLALVAVSHAGCVGRKIKAGVTHCQDLVDKTWHPVGSSWTNSKCAKCHCGSDYASCCDGWPTSTIKGCIIEYDYHTCEYEIINLEHPSLPCAAAGK